MKAFLWSLAVLSMISASVDAQRRTDKVMLQGNVAGSQTVDVVSKDSAKAEYSYNDRGRGEHIIATWKLDAAGIPTQYDGHGNDYMKAPVEEQFAIENGKAKWKSRSEHGEKAITGGAFYLPVDPPPEFTGVLARALLKAPNHQLQLLPSGEATIEEAAKLKLDANREITLYRISGIAFQPISIWLTDSGDTAGTLSDWFSVFAPDIESRLPDMRARQQDAENTWSQRMAASIGHKPDGDLMIRNVRLFDPRDLSVTSGMSVLVHGDRIVRIDPAGSALLTSEVTKLETIDAGGKFLMPGLWDNHQHFSGVDGALDLANGVTSARDMANNTDAFLDRVARFDAGTELGPNVLKAGIIDGTGELAGPTKMRVDTAQQAIEDVNWYADHGYVQIKIYSSVKPELVRVIADQAHGRGLRVSGHVPAFMSARQFVEAGADEIQHLNFIELNFLFPEVKETRNRDRFIKVAERAREFTPDKAPVREFIGFLKQHHTVLDPTMNVFEGLFCGDPTRVTPALEDVAPRFPPQIRRALLSGALEVPKGKEDAYREAFPSMLKLLKALYDAGVTIVPGTDALAGYTLHYELELYARAGIPSAEVLRMATLTPAQVMGVTKDRGAIASGKIADMILIDGDPTRDMHQIRNVSMVIKGGKTYDPAAIEKALGIAPRVGGR